MSIVIFIIVLAVLILVHEFGHFIIAKRRGIRVDEFGIGFPPRIFGKKFGETTYTVNWIPFGGFVRIFGENNEDIQTDEDRKVSFIYKGFWTKFFVLAGGIIFNIAMAWVLLISITMIGMPVSATDSSFEYPLEDEVLMITSIQPDSPAESAGLMPGSIINYLKDGDAIVEDPSVMETQEFIGTRGDVSFEIGYQLKRDSEVLVTELTPETGVFEDRVAVGIALDRVGNLKLPFGSAVVEGTKITGTLLYATVFGYADLIKDIFVGRGGEVLEVVSGPVGIAGLVGDAFSIGVVPLLMLTAIISISLAVINLIPFPALDGGRILFLIIEKIKGSPISSKTAGIVNATGFFILIALMVIVTINDIVRLF